MSNNKKKNKTGVCYLDNILSLNIISPWSLSLQLECLCYIPKLLSFNEKEPKHYSHEMGDPTVAGVYKQKDRSCTKGFMIAPIILIH